MSGNVMKYLVRVSVMLLLISSCLTGQDSAQQPPSPKNPVEDYSGMYAFLQDGEFVQVTVEDAGRVTGFVSRYGDLESDRGAFLDQFFKTGKRRRGRSRSRNQGRTGRGTGGRSSGRLSSPFSSR